MPFLADFNATVTSGSGGAAIVKDNASPKRLMILGNTTGGSGSRQGQVRSANGFVASCALGREFSLFEALNVSYVVPDEPSIRVVRGSGRRVVGVPQAVSDQRRV